MNPYEASTLPVAPSIVARSFAALTVPRMLLFAAGLGIGLWIGIYFGIWYGYRLAHDDAAPRYFDSSSATPRSFVVVR